MNRIAKRKKVYRKIKWLICVLIFLTIIATAGLMAVSAQYLNNDGNYMVSMEKETTNTEPAVYVPSKVLQSERGEMIQNIEKEDTEALEDVSVMDQENDLASNTVYIGDSRMEGFIINSGITDVIAYTDIGMTVESVFSKPVIYMNGNTVTVIEALRKTDFNKVYIMLGINETGWSYDSVFIEKYKELIDEIQSLNSDADIYIQSILPVSQNVSDTHQYINNDRIECYNELLQNLAQEENVHYLNVAEVMKDENGALPDNAAFDGIHLKKEYCLKWLKYIENNS